MLALRENEKIKLIKRRHWLVLVRDLLFVGLLSLIVVILTIITFFVSFELPEQITNSIPFLAKTEARFFFLFLFSGTLLILLQISLIIIADYYLDCWIVTNQRTIHTELKGLFNRVVSSVPHNRIQDVTVTVKGIFPTLLKYGDLRVQTAGKHQDFIFQQIPNPYKVQELISKEQKEYLKEAENETNDDF